MKKIILLLIILCLFGCQKETTDEIINIEGKYIEPINEVSYYESLKSETRNKIGDLYEKAPQNNIMKMFKKEFCELTLRDYYGNTIDFSKLKNTCFVMEISQKVCDHCQKEIPLMETILEKTDVKIYQYFANASNEEIDEFYSKSSHQIPSGLTILPEDDEMSDYITELGVDSTPTFLFVNNGVIEFACIGELAYPRFASALRFIKSNPLAKEDFVNSEGVDVFSLGRDYDSVLDDLSIQSKDKLALVDEAEELTVNVIGKYVEFFNVYELGEEAPLYTVNFTKYVNKPLIVFYLANINDNLENDISIINEFKNNHKDINMVAILMDNKDLSTSLPYRDLDTKLNIDVVSSNAEVVVSLLDTDVYEYPAALFIQDNTFQGGLHTIQDVDNLERAFNIFLGEDSIALVSNNIN